MGKAGNCPKCLVPLVGLNGKWGFYYSCPNYPTCDITRSKSPDGKRLSPPSDAATRDAKKKLHALFDRLWQRGYTSRGGAYRWLRDAMGMQTEDCHIIMFDKELCEKATALIKATFPPSHWAEEENG